VFAYVRCRGRVSVQSKLVKSAKKNAAGDKKPKSSSANASRASGEPSQKAKTSGKQADANKFELYFDFRSSISAIKPHQVSVFCTLQFYDLRAKVCRRICICDCDVWQFCC